MTNPSVIFSALRSFDLFQRVEASMREQWLTEEQRSIWHAVQRCHEQRKERTVPWVDLRVELKGKKGYDRINDYERRAKGVSKLAMQKCLAKFLEVHFLEDLLERIAKEHEAGKTVDYEEVIKEIEEIQRLGCTALSTTAFLDEDPRKWIPKIEQLPTVPFPIQELNRALNGGMKVGRTVTILARTDGGKTSFAINVGRHAIEQGYTVLHATFEEPPADLKVRYACSIMNHTWEWVASHPKTTSKKFCEIRQKGGWLEIADYADAEGSLSNLQAEIDRLIRKRGHIDLLIIDSGDDVRSNKHYEEPTLEMKAVWTGIRRFAKRYNIPALVTTQANREGAKAERTQLIHISAAWGKATQSPEVYVLDIPKGSKRGIVEIVKTKAKGTYPTIPIYFNRERNVMR